MSLETSNQIQMSYVLSLYPKICLCKVRKKSEFMDFDKTENVSVFTPLRL